jgi:hypothetical protein
MIQIERDGGLVGPIILCDHCGKRIKDAERAAALMPESGRHASGVLYVHKGECHDALENREGGSVPWEELSRHLRLLATNAGLQTGQMEQAKKVDSEVGYTNE